MSRQPVFPTVWSRALRRAINTMLAMVMLVQPGCMCGCSAPTTVASARARNDGACSSLDSCKHCDKDDERRRSQSTHLPVTERIESISTMEDL